MKKNNLIEGTMIATFAIILVKILGMLYVIPFYKIVGETGGALYSYSYNIYAIFLAISSAGLPSAVSKVISEYNTLGLNEAKNRAYRIAKDIISTISVIAFAFLFVFADEIGKFIIKDLSGGNTSADVAFVVRCISPAILVIPFLSITKGYLQGHKFVTPSSLAELIEQFVRIIVILLGSYLCLKVFNKSLSVTIGIAVSGAFFGGVAAYIFLKHKIRKNQKELNYVEEKNGVLKTIVNDIPVLLVGLSVYTYFYFDTLNQYKVVKMIALIMMILSPIIIGLFIHKRGVESRKDNEIKEGMDDVHSSVIAKKIIMYAIPFVIISLVTHIYFFTDQILILRALDHLGYDDVKVEFIASAISTWSPKILTIITAIGSGMAIALIPTIVASHTKKDKVEVTENINKSLSLVISLSLPVTLGISILAPAIWTLFYGKSVTGSLILRWSVCSAILANVYLVVMDILQSLNKFKLVYVFSFTGFILNALLDVPMMYLCHYIGIPAYLGSIMASVIGYSTSIIIGLVALNKIDDVNYKHTGVIILKNLVPGMIMTVVLVLINNVLPISMYTYTGALITCVIDVIVGGIIYLFIAYKNGLLVDVLGKEFINKVLRKLTKGKLKIN